MNIIANRKMLSIVYIVVLTMLFNIVVYADGEVQKYDLEKLKEIYINQSFEIDMIDLETKLLQIQYNDRIKDYKDFKKVVDDFENKQH